MARQRRYEESLDEDLQDPAEAASYLNACLESGDPEVFLLALRDLARARGGVAKLAPHLLDGFGKSLLTNADLLVRRNLKQGQFLLPRHRVHCTSRQQKQGAQQDRQFPRCMISHD